MKTKVIRCDFSKAFEQAFRNALNSMPDEICLCILHPISLGVTLDPDRVNHSSIEWSVLQSLQVQAEKEFEILNKRSNPTSRPVVFQVKFT